MKCENRGTVKIMPVTSANLGATHIAVGALREIHIHHVLVPALTPSMHESETVLA